MVMFIRLFYKTDIHVTILMMAYHFFQTILNSLVSYIDVGDNAMLVN